MQRFTAMRGKRSLVPALALVGFIFLGLAGDDENKTNTYVRVDLTANPAVVKAGGKGEIQIQFQPIEGIHVNAAPPTVLTLAEDSPVKLTGESVVPVDSTTGYLDASKPTTYSFAVKKSTRPGDRKINGTLVYFFCSDKEGWCLRWQDDVSFTLSVER